MPNKPTEAIDVLPTFVTCPECGGERFQVHERGTLTHNPDGVIVVEYDELACQCLNCHHVLTLPVSGAIDYQA